MDANEAIQKEFMNDAPKVNGNAPEENGVSLVPVVVEVATDPVPESEPERIEEPVEENVVSVEESVPVESVPNAIPEVAQVREKSHLWQGVLTESLHQGG